MAVLTATWLVAVLAGTVRTEWVHNWRCFRRSAMLLVAAVVILAVTLAPGAPTDMQTLAVITGVVHAVGLALLLLAYWPMRPGGEETAEQDTVEGRSE